VNTTSSLMLTGGIVTLGRWAEGKPLSMRVVLGAGFVALMLAGVSNADKEFGRKFALLILVIALYAYGPPILTRSGLAS
jgi:hypothetical protein